MAANATERLASMTDAQLRQAFVDAGYRPGPCIPSTRKTLESIYKKMASGEDVAKFFTQSTRSAAPISTTVNGADDEEDHQPVEQGRRSTAGQAPRTPHNESIFQHMPVNTSTPTPSFVGKPEAKEVESENYNPTSQYHIGKSPAYEVASQKISIVSSSSVSSAKYSQSSQLPVPTQSVPSYQSEQARTTPIATPVGRIHYPEKETKVSDYFSSQSRPEVIVKTTTASSYYGTGSASRQYTSTTGSFNPSLITPREPVKNTPVSTGGFDIRQRKVASVSPANAANAGGAAQKGGSNTVLILFLLIVAAAIAYYFVFLSSSNDDGDVGIPKISGDGPSVGVHD